MGGVILVLIASAIIYMARRWKMSRKASRTNDETEPKRHELEPGQQQTYQPELSGKSYAVELHHTGIQGREIFEMHAPGR